METVYQGEALRTAQLEIRPDEGLVLAGGRALAFSVRELHLLTALARREGRVVSRAELYALAWQGVLRNGDRSVDVYVRRLRVKLETALPDRRFIHTHVGFGYRFAPEPAPPSRSHDFHTTATAR
ncbi:MAG: winged helix-turn-helix domain-containing protein [Actinomycetota bacterium]|nr:winged helix-turn-helix domain-containing protein [Actinomycetota bacterium]